MIDSTNAAVLAGYTEEILAYAYGSDLDLHLLIKPGTDLDGAFKAFCADEQEMIRVNGWLFTFEQVQA